MPMTERELIKLKELEILSDEIFDKYLRDIITDKMKYSDIKIVNKRSPRTNVITKKPRSIFRWVRNEWP
jgi:hypothetical protein